MKNTQNASTSSFNTTFDSEGRIIASDFWGSKTAQNKRDYITCEGGVVRRLLTNHEALLDESNAKVAMVTIGKVTHDIAPDVPLGEEVLEIYYNDGGENPLLSHHSLNLVEYTCDLPKFGKATKLEIWDFHKGEPRLRLTLKCKITKGTVPNLANIFGIR